MAGRVDDQTGHPWSRTQRGNQSRHHWACQADRGWVWPERHPLQSQSRVESQSPPELASHLASGPRRNAADNSIGLPWGVFR